MKLKTLEDLRGLASLPYPMDGCLRRDLREEAIKWIKSPKLEDDEFTIPVENSDGSYGGESYNVENWIKHFFNITEEDLK